jgi:PPP family 3-phenylpropionic acid transporter
VSPRLRLIAWYLPALGALAAAPFLAPVLSDKGLSDPAIATVLTLQPLGALLAAPAWAWVADRGGDTRRLLAGLGLGTALALALLATPLGPTGAVAALALFAATWPAQSPLVDALAVRSLPDAGRGYSRIRLWGSVSFLAAVALNGPARDAWGPAPMAFGAGLLLLAVLATRGLPDLRAVPRPPSPRDWARLLADPELALLGLASVLHGVGLAYYNAFFARHVEVLGLASAWTSAALGLAVAVEVGVMAMAPRWLVRARPAVLVAIAMGASAPRWWGTALATDPAAIVALQAIHGLSFGLFWSAAVPAFARRAPPGLERSAQALLPATAFGVGPLLGLAVARVALREGTPAVLFQIGAAASVLATVAAMALVLRTPRPGRRTTP